VKIKINLLDQLWKDKQRNWRENQKEDYGRLIDIVESYQQGLKYKIGPGAYRE
jgi:hypothetical protein